MARVWRLERFLASFSIASSVDVPVYVRYAIVTSGGGDGSARPSVTGRVP